MIKVAIIILSVCVIAAALLSIAPCILSSKISQAEERKNYKED